mmetsp:Transcript_6618/g.17231  ORF Transcript_6618/g.17231 Transcript_6618/m.17231 type:complete len:204 (-) Transcript_6618:336-947(-)
MAANCMAPAITALSNARSADHANFELSCVLQSPQTVCPGCAGARSSSTTCGQQALGQTCSSRRRRPVAVPSRRTCGACGSCSQSCLAGRSPRAPRPRSAPRGPAARPICASCSRACRASWPWPSRSAQRCTASRAPRPPPLRCLQASAARPPPGPPWPPHSCERARTRASCTVPPPRRRAHPPPSHPPRTGPCPSPPRCNGAC